MAGRPSQAKTLAVWMNGEHVGHWTVARGRHLFSYDPSWIESPQARPLSLSLPLTDSRFPATGTRVEAYFENLLPDSEHIRRRLAGKYGADSTSAIDLLTRIGQDCVGAVQLLPVDVRPINVKTIEADPLSDEQIEQLLIQTTSAQPHWQGQPDDLRISIAGAQEKTALLWHQNRWCLPKNATPTTHIFKLPLGVVGGMQADFSTSVENEWLCGEILRGFGLKVAHSSMATFGKTKCLIVERFDRRKLDIWWARLPQEDFCQVMGVPSIQKYEDKGGPGMAAILEVLRGSDNAEMDRRDFLKAQLLFWMLCAPDGHAKNFSLFIERGGNYHLTPLYDVMSAWPVVGHGANRFEYKNMKMAMGLKSKNKHYHFEMIRRHHWNVMAKTNALGNDFEDVIKEVIEMTPSVINSVAKSLPTGFPAQVSDPIFFGMQSHANKIAAQKA